MNRNQLIKHIELHIAKAGSQSALASRIGINVGSLSTIMRGKYGANEDKMLKKIAAALNYKDRDWNVCREVYNYKVIENAVTDVREESLWLIVSNKAGSGKTEALEDLYNRDHSGAVIFVQAEEWTGRQFMSKLLEKTTGIPKGSRYISVSEMVGLVTDYFLEMPEEKPVLIIDEADKLKPSALRCLIPIYNKTEHRLGCLLAGTENLEKEIKNGVRLSRKGYDEIESRCGRSYIKLRGASISDVKLICKANGVSDKETQESIWYELDKSSKQVRVRTKSGEKFQHADFVEDFRRLMRLIKKARIRKNKAA